MQEVREPEVWKDIPGYEGLYQVSSWGNVKSLERYTEKCRRKISEKVLNLAKRNGYRYVELYRNGVYIRKNICEIVNDVFNIKKNSNEFINHKDLNKLNDYYKNLEAISPRENSTHHNLRKHNLPGAHYDVSGKRLRRWRSSIIVNGNKIGLGSYYTEDEAHKAYLEALKFYGLENKYATVNQSL